MAKASGLGLGGARLPDFFLVLWCQSFGSGAQGLG